MELLSKVELSNEKRKAFKSAEEMLHRNDDDLLLYVALELRLCLEAVVYEKLWARKEWIPQDAARAWRLPQAFAALLSIEPEAEHSATLAVAPEMTPGAMPSRESLRALGVDLRPQSRWLKKTWKKLGSLLHAQSPFAKQAGSSSSNRRRQDLSTILRELEPFVQSDFTFAFCERGSVRFDCYWCKKVVTVNAVALENGNEVRCLRCNCKFFAVKEGDDFIFHPDIADVLCACQQTIAVPAHKLTSGYQFPCHACGCQFEVTGQAWQFRRVGEQEVKTNMTPPKA